MTWSSFALPAAARCERPRQASASASSDQPGRLAQGPDEKKGRRGRSDGFVKAYSFQNRCDPLGGRVPSTKLGSEGGAVKWHVAVHNVISRPAAPFRQMRDPSG